MSESKRNDRLEPVEVVKRIDELLELTYRSANLENLEDPLNVTIYALLCSHMDGILSQQVYQRLETIYPGWHAVLNKSEKDLVGDINLTGFKEDHAKTLKLFLEAIAGANRTRGAQEIFSLKFLHDMTDDSAIDFLKNLPGVSPIIKFVMAYALHKKYLAIDISAKKILERLDLIEYPNNEVNFRNIESITPPKIRKRLYLNLIHHSQKICRSRQPKCGDCVIVSFCSKQNYKISANKPVVVELFGGAGGLGKGFSKAGYKIAVAVEKDRNSAQTYRLNHPGTPVLEADIKLLDVEDLRRFIFRVDDISVLMAGPPCQGYSVAGKRNPADPDNLLYEEVTRFAKMLQPRIVLLENVLGLRKVKGVDFASKIRDAIQKVGYKVEGPMKLEASRFGVSQNRSRLIYLARRADLGGAPSPPDPTHVPADEEIASNSIHLPRTPTLEEILEDLPDFGTGINMESGIMNGVPIYNASTMAHSQHVVEKISQISPGEGPISYRRLDRRAAQTLVAGHRALPVHPWKDRTISVREAARIQGFPDDFVFAGPRSSQPLQVANAVPPPMAEALARHLLRFLNYQLPISASLGGLSNK